MYGTGRRRTWHVKNVYPQRLISAVVQDVFRLNNILKQQSDMILKTKLCIGIVWDGVRLPDTKF